MDAKANTHVCPSPFRQDGSMGDSASAASAYMIVVSGSVPGTMLLLKERGTTLGRSSECEFQIDDITVSRRHALVAVGPEGIARITDLGSANGTFVNGEAIPHAGRSRSKTATVFSCVQGGVQDDATGSARRAVSARHV